MGIQQSGRAPYAPAQTVVDLLEGYRERGYATPFTPDVLIRAGVGEGLVNRVLQALKILELVDETGQPTDQLEALKRARGDDEYKARLQEWLRSVYSEILQFADPAVDSPDRLSEAFRGYEPSGQRSRMVTLMVGLFRYAGLIDEQPKRAAQPRTPKRGGPTKPAPRREPVRHIQFASPYVPMPEPTAAGLDGLPPALVGILGHVPRNGKPWTADRRDEFLRIFAAVLDFAVPVAEEEPLASLLASTLYDAGEST